MKFSGFLRELTGIVFSFEMVFILFLRVGRFKTAPVFKFVPIDLTLLFLLLGISLGCIVLIKRQFRLSLAGLKYLFVFLLFLLFTWCSLEWSLSSVYAREKIIKLTILCLYCVISGSLIIGHDLQRIRRFLLSLLIVDSLITLQVAVASIHHAPGTSLNTLVPVGTKGAYLGISSVLCCLLTMLLIFCFFYKKSYRIVILLPFLFFLIMDVGGRGPLVSMFFSVSLIFILFKLLPLLSDKKISQRAIKTILIIVLMLFGIRLTCAFYRPVQKRILKSTTIKRFEVIIKQERGGSSVNQRLLYINDAIDMFFEKPLVGYGIGSFPLIINGIDKKNYPHNIILEVLAELGIIGGLLYGTFLFLPICRIKHFINRYVLLEHIIILGLFVYYLLWSFISGTITSVRELYVFASLLSVAIPNAPKMKSQIHAL